MAPKPAPGQELANVFSPLGSSNFPVLPQHRAQLAHRELATLCKRSHKFATTQPVHTPQMPDLPGDFSSPAPRPVWFRFVYLRGPLVERRFTNSGRSRTSAI